MKPAHSQTLFSILCKAYTVHVTFPGCMWDEFHGFLTFEHQSCIGNNGLEAGMGTFSVLQASQWCGT